MLREKPLLLVYEALSYSDKNESPAPLASFDNIYLYIYIYIYIFDNVCVCVCVFVCVCVCVCAYAEHAPLGSAFGDVLDRDRGDEIELRHTR